MTFVNCAKNHAITADINGLLCKIVSIIRTSPLIMEYPYFHYKENGIHNTMPFYEIFADLFFINFGCLFNINFVFAIEKTNNAIHIKKNAIICALVKCS